MPLILIVENFSLMDEHSQNAGLNEYINSKCKPNKGVVTRNSLYCHNCVNRIVEKGVIVSNIPACHLQLFSALLLL